ncbi:MAG: hypothetical protein R6W81_01225, partial [Bacteroidales bacterium]
MAKTTLMSLAAAFILQQNGEKIRPRELASGVLALDPSHFAKKKSEYEARSGGRSADEGTSPRSREDEF